MSLELAASIERARAAGERLRRASDAEVRSAITGAVAALAAEPLGAALRTGLSEETASWGLATTLSELSPAALTAALARLPRGARPRALQGLVLAGNVFTSGLRPVAWSLLARVPVLAKVASTDAGLLDRFAAAISASSPALAGAVTVTRFSREVPELYRQLAAAVEVVSVHGSDETVETLRGQTPPGTAFVEHGHGVGLALLTRDAVVDTDALDALALDLAAYDQHGCLSPAAVLVEDGGARSAGEIALALHRALDRVEARLPRGALGDLAASQAQWRGVASALFTLHESATSAVSYEAGAAIRPTPGHRNVAVHTVASLAALGERLERLGPHLKCIGLLGERARLAPCLPTRPPPIVPLGAMQRPTLLAPTDGYEPWHGLFVSEP